MTRRLLAGYLAVTLAVLAVLVIPLGLAQQRRLQREVTAELERDAFVLASYAQADLVAAGIISAPVETEVARYAGDVGARVVIVDGQGIALVDTEPPEPGERDFANRPEVASALSGQAATGRRRSDTLDTDLVFAAVPVAAAGDVVGAIRVTYSTADLDARVLRTWLLLAAVALVSLVAVSGLAVLIARWVARPVRRLEEAAVALGAGDLDRRVPEDEGPPELRSLAVAFNRTAQRLRDVLVAQDAFVADAAHQLRTPLTALRLRLENLTDHAEADDGAGVDVEAALGEAERLSRTVDGLLTLARLDRAAPHQRRLVALRPLLEERAVMWAPLAEEQDVRLEVHADAAVAVTDPDHLAQALDNLLANVLDAAPPDTTIRLIAELSGPQTLVHVIDEGPGMTFEEREHAFDRFWSGGGGRFGGSGLGLTLVQRLVQVNDGNVELAGAPGGGIDAVITLPAGRG